jgi:hypothetical protein
MLFIYLFCGTGVWTQGLHLEPLHQSPFFGDGFFQNRVLQTICLAALELQSSYLCLLSS